MRDSHGGLLEVHARERVGMPETWHLYYFEHVTLGNSYVGYRLRGAIAPPKRPRPGERHLRFMWDRKDAATDREVNFTTPNHDTWVARWEARTGKCRACLGDGKVTWSVSIADGVTCRECRTCRGTGKTTDKLSSESPEISDSFY